MYFLEIRTVGIIKVLILIYKSKPNPPVRIVQLDRYNYFTEKQYEPKPYTTSLDYFPFILV